jgi:hypothetical protein
MRSMSLFLRETEINLSFYIDINIYSLEIESMSLILSDFRVKLVETSSLVCINILTLDIELIATILDIF